MSDDERPTPREVLHGAYIEWVNSAPTGVSQTFGDFADEALADEGYVVIDATE